MIASHGDGAEPSWPRSTATMWRRRNQPALVARPKARALPRDRNRVSAASRRHYWRAVAHSRRRRTPPPAALSAARMRLLDGLAVALAALPAASVVRPRAALALFGRDGPASAIGRGQTCAIAAAALHNGLLMHGLEFDDTHVGGVVHGAPVVLPAVLACAGTGVPAPRSCAPSYWWEPRKHAGPCAGSCSDAFQATRLTGDSASAGRFDLTASGLGDGARTGHRRQPSPGVFEFLASGATRRRFTGRAEAPGWSRRRRRGRHDGPPSY